MRDTTQSNRPSSSITTRSNNTSARNNNNIRNNSNIKDHCLHYEFLADFAEKVNQHLLPYNNFITILCAISKHSDNDNHNNNVNNNNCNVYNQTKNTLMMNQVEHDVPCGLSSPSQQQQENKLLVQQSNNSNISLCYLSLLDLGKETKIHAYSQLIAQYIGVPIGKPLRLLLQAKDNLKLWGI